jgi:hypothetical protein
VDDREGDEGDPDEERDHDQYALYQVMDHIVFQAAGF